MYDFESEIAHAKSSKPPRLNTFSDAVFGHDHGDVSYVLKMHDILLSLAR